jgi:arylamine N-acetyltransferase
MNMSASQHPQSLFLNLLVCINVDYRGLDAISRHILVNTDLKKRENGETKRIVVFKTEEERVVALKDMFRIALTVDEREAIKGQKLAVDKFNPQNHFDPF